MRQNIFLTITKWWCNCLDLCFEIMARPWKEEELPYRRMICAIFDQDWKLPKSFSEVNQGEIPRTFKGLREYLATYTHNWLNSRFVARNVTPAWPEGTIEYLEATLSDIFTEPPVTDMTEPAIKAFRLMHEVGDRHVPRKRLAETLGVDQTKLYTQLHTFEYQLRHPKNAHLFQPFAFQNSQATARPDAIVNGWLREKLVREWNEAVALGKAPSEIEYMPVEHLELSVRTYNCLKNANLQTVGDILRTSETEMLQKKNFGRKSLNELKEVLEHVHPLLKIGMLWGAVCSSEIIAD